MINTSLNLNEALLKVGTSCLVLMTSVASLYMFYGEGC